MEAVGVIGLARFSYTGGKIGSRLFHAKDPWGENHELDDQPRSVDHFFCKLLKPGETMKMAPRRKLTEENTDYLRVFLDKFREEPG